MNIETIGKLMKVLLAISALTILAGAIFKLQHWAYSDIILMTGLIANFGLSSYEIKRLKRFISKLKCEKSKVN